MWVAAVGEDGLPVQAAGEAPLLVSVVGGGGEGLPPLVTRHSAVADCLASAAGLCRMAMVVDMA